MWKTLPPVYTCSFRRLLANTDIILTLIRDISTTNSMVLVLNLALEPVLCVNFLPPDICSQCQFLWEIFRPSVDPVVKAKTCSHNCQLFLFVICLYLLLLSVNDLFPFFWNITVHFCSVYHIELRLKGKKKQ